MKSPKKSVQNQLPTAIIGMGCFFPKSSGLKEYWRLIAQGEDGITEVPHTHWSAEDYYHPDPKNPDHVYCKRGGFLSPVMFDPAEFGIPPHTLEATDTSQILGLVAAKMALTDAGYGDGNGRKFNRDRTSVILGVTGTQELVIPLSSRLGFPKWRRALEAAGVPTETTEKVIEGISQSYVGWQENSFPGLLGNVVAGKICNRLDLGGTNCVVDAACASSMSAIHLAVMELSCDRSDMVITGGVDTLNDIFMHMCFSKTQTLSPTGDARPFSKNADGTVLGEGIGLLVLKRLADAEKDGDRIYAVIRALGSASDGKSQSIYAPRVEGQVKALRVAYKNSAVRPSTVELVEAHGTGTRVGDKVEFNAMCQVFDKQSSNGHKCALGSVKSMIGHTKAAAGAAGLIKTALSLYHKILPPTLKVEKPDPNLDMDHSPFYLNTETRPWLTRDRHPRRAGVSAFGFGGSNFHIVLEEHQPQKNEISWDGSVEIVALSGSDQKQLARKLSGLKTNTENDASKRQLSIQAAESRRMFSHQDAYRLLFTLDQHLIESGAFRDLFSDAFNILESDPKGNSWNINNTFYGGPQRRGKLALLFPGQGSQYIGMGRDLVCYFPEALRVIGNANKAFQKAQLLSDFICPRPPQTKEEEKSQIETLTKTEIAQPAIGAVSLAMLKILQRFGIRPDATCGHSFGELTALHAAGCFDQTSFLQLAVKRGKIMAAVAGDIRQGKGSMLAVSAPLEEIKKIIQGHDLDVTLANINSPSQGVLSGHFAAVSAVEKIFRQKGFKTMRLPVSAAFHSPLVGDARKPFLNTLKKIRFISPEIPIYSNSTAKSYPSDAAGIIELLGNHLLKPVDFVNDIENLYQSDIRTFVEVGPKSILTGLVRSILQGREFQALAMDRSAGSRFGLADLALTLCHLAAIGYSVELDKWESPVADVREPMMRIPISGTNYWRSNTATKPKKPSNPEQSDETPNSRLNIHSPRQIDPPEVSVPQTSFRLEKKNTMKKEKQPDNDFVSDALKTIQDGLKSMQALQIKTAETHQQFLQAQAAAGRTLQAMMERTQRLAEASLGISSSPQTLPGTPLDSPQVFTQIGEGFSEVPHNAPGLKTSPQNVPFGDTASQNPTLNGDPPYGTSDNLARHPNLEPTGTSRQELENTLLGLVNQLTGYPAEMLGLDMDIEADLGIDSIKRVEILSTLEEKIPNLPPMSPDMLGRLKTLGQIIDYISDVSKIDTPDPTTVASATAQNPLSVEVTQTVSSDSDKKELLDNLLATVHQLTGYPVEMLGLDMDIEADLGIDSIKRVEILSTLEEKIPNLPSMSPDILGSLKTLGQIADHLAGHLADGVSLPAGAKPSRPPSDTSFNKEERIAPEPSETGLISGQVKRYVVSVAARTYRKGSSIKIPSGSKVLITDDGKGLSQALADEFSRRDIDSKLISPDSAPQKQKPHTVGGLIYVPNPDSLLRPSDLKTAFALAQNIAPQLLESAEKGGAIFASITRLDGAFGFNGAGLNNPLQGAFAGLVKTAAIEWQAVNCCAIDIAPDWRRYRNIAKKIVSELVAPAGAFEIGMDHGKRVVLELDAAPFARNQDIRIDLNPTDVVVVTGGARGITAAATYALANNAQATFVLLGRSPYPTPEPPWLNALTNEADMKRAILENQFKDRKTSPALLEKTYKKFSTHREISANLDRLKAAGATVSYYSVDVRDPKAVKSLLEAVRKEHGPIKAIIHGAGVLEDRLILDKTAQQFEKVFDTKVKGLNSLLEATRQDALKYLVLFSSITARIGNRGQVDYAMANEAINKMAQQESKIRPQCKVVSINWGPWAGGMVTPALKNEFERNGIQLISLDEGAKCLLYEMSEEKSGPVEVVMGSNKITPQIVKPGQGHKAAPGHLQPQKKEEEFLITFKREIDVDRYPILDSHVLGGKPVVPFALMTEWFAHSALHNNPGLFLCGFDDMRILHGIKIEQEKRIVRLLAGKARKKRSVWEVAVELRDGFKNGIEVIHSKAKAVLSETMSPPPKYSLPVELKANDYPRSVEEVYNKILFHGAGLHGIKKIISLSERGMMARISSAPLPSVWMKQPLRNHWIGDPLVLDSAFQMATVWCYENMGLVSLPSYMASYRQYRSKFPAEGVTAVLEVQASSEHKMTGDITFLDQDNVVVARLTGYQAIADPSLFKAFHSA